MKKKDGNEKKEMVMKKKDGNDFEKNEENWTNLSEKSVEILVLEWVT
jgi:hypothetical protein